MAWRLPRSASGAGAEMGSTVTSRWIWPSQASLCAFWSRTGRVGSGVGGSGSPGLGKEGCSPRTGVGAGQRGVKGAARRPRADAGASFRAGEARADRAGSPLVMFCDTQPARGRGGVGREQKHHTSATPQRRGEAWSVHVQWAMRTLSIRRADRRGGVTMGLSSRKRSSVTSCRSAGRRGNSGGQRAFSHASLGRWLLQALPHLIPRPG